MLPKQNGLTNTARDNSGRGGQGHEIKEFHVKQSDRTNIYK